MNAIQLRTRIFTDSYSRRASEMVLDLVLECLVQIDMLFLRLNPQCPKLYDSGVRYYHEGIVDEWFDIPEALHERVADCKTLSAWRVAELRLSGEDPKAQCEKTFAEMEHPDGSTMLLYHIRVSRSNGTIEDPSRKLGMNKPEPDGYIPLPGISWVIANGMTSCVGAALQGDERALLQLETLRKLSDAGDKKARYLVNVARLIRQRGYTPDKDQWQRRPDNSWGWGE